MTYITERRKGLLWLAVCELLAQDWLVPRRKHHGRRVWGRKAAQLMEARKERVEEDPGEKGRGQGPGVSSNACCSDPSISS